MNRIITETLFRYIDITPEVQLIKGVPGNIKFELCTIVII